MIYGIVVSVGIAVKDEIIVRPAGKLNALQPVIMRNAALDDAVAAGRQADPVAARVFHFDPANMPIIFADV